jgi:hypothetical protein
MGNFKKFHEKNNINEQDIKECLMALAYLGTLENVNESEFQNLTEASILAGIANMFGKAEAGIDKIGMKLHKGKGVLSYIADFNDAASFLVYAAIKGDKEEVLRLAKTFDKSKFVDFLLKLDMLSMHILTGPIHMIDAITGWDLIANLKAHTSKAENIIDSIEKAISDLKAKISTLMDTSIADKVNSFFDSISDMLFATPEALKA